MISKSLAIEVLNKALETGADYAEIYYEDTLNKAISIENQKVNVSLSNSVNGVGLRILKENRSIYGTTSDLSKKGLLSLASSLASSFNAKRILEVKELNKFTYKNRNKITDSYSNHNKEEYVTLMKEGIDVIKKMNDPRIVRTTSSFLIEQKNVTIFNSKGQYFNRNTEHGRLAFLVIVLDNQNLETSFSGPGAQRGLDYFKNSLNVREIARKTAETALKMVNAKECPSGKMDVVLGNGWGGVLFHESCGHPLEASSVSKGLSPFAGKIGEKIASDVVSAYDDSTIPGGWGSIDIDDEGNLGKKGY